MDILILGNTAREHALAWKFAESRKTGELYCTSTYSGVDTLCTRIDAPPETWRATHSVDLVVEDTENCMYRAAFDCPENAIRVTVDCLTDGHTIVPMPAVRIYSDKTDGTVAAEAPAGEYTKDMAHRAYHRFFIPYIRGTGSKQPRLFGIVRFEMALCGNEPELLAVYQGVGELDAMALLPLLRADLAELLTACAGGRLSGEMVRLNEQTTAVCMLGAQQEGVHIRGLDRVAKNTGVFFGSVRLEEGKLKTAGRRALFVCARGQDRHSALHAARSAADVIQYEGQIRYHIGHKTVLPGNQV